MTPIKELKLYYFSGTGNAKQVALWFSQIAQDRGIVSHLFNIAKTEVSAIQESSPETLIAIISPIHGFNFPKITLKFIEHFPRGENNILLLNTRAGMRIGRFATPGLTGVAFMLASFFLKRKGYRIIGQIPFDMPSNWISIHPALRDKSIQFLHRKNYERVQKHASQVFSGQTDFHAYRDIVQDVLISPVSLSYYLVGRFAFAKSFYATDACDNCGICEKNCPVHAIISIQNRPFWTFQCESCMKCMNSCPKNAIETGHGFFVVITIISIFVTYLLDGLLLHSLYYENLRFILSNIIFIILLWLLYKFQHVILTYKWIARIISFSSLTHFKFWGRYKSIPDHKWKK
jgi:Pyruvate/2-oxoacid:ferredoxin oxidoreductase delta subunit